jgi:hypothetical protein
MTWTLAPTATVVPFPVRDDRTTPRVANLSARGGLHRAHTARVLAARRAQEGHVEASPEIETAPTVIESLTAWWGEASASRYFWCTLAWSAIAAVFIAALIVIR